MNTKTTYTIFWLTGFALIIFGALYKSGNEGLGKLIFFSGLALTVIAVVIRLTFLKKR